MVKTVWAPTAWQFRTRPPLDRCDRRRVCQRRKSAKTVQSLANGARVSWSKLRKSNGCVDRERRQVCTGPVRMQDVAASYRPRSPESAILYSVVARNLETFLARRQECERPVPTFVEHEFRSYLDCGVLERGFLRLRCESCGRNRLLAFSCKNRGFCPSCCGRKMTGTAAHLVDSVIPAVPVRQWVLSLPYSLRFRAAFDSELMGELLGIFVREVFASLRKRAKDNGVLKGKCGSVTFVQRFGSAANCNLHFHSIVFDGVYACAEENGPPRFYPPRAPESADVAAVATRVAVRVASLLERRDGVTEPQEPAIADLYAASIMGTQAIGPIAGQKVKMAGEFHDESFQTHGTRCAMVSGFSVHAGVSIRAEDRNGLERLLRYGGRSPIAADRLEQLPDGRLSYRLKAPWKNGTTHVIFEPLDFMARRFSPGAPREFDPVPRAAGSGSKVARGNCSGIPRRRP